MINESKNWGKFLRDSGSFNMQIRISHIVNRLSTETAMPDVNQ